MPSNSEYSSAKDKRTCIVSFSGSGLNLGALHDAMLSAFSDYVVPMQPDAATFEATLRTRGFDPKASFVAVESDEIVGFWNVATRHNRRYLISSGTRIDHRGRGIASGLGRAAIAAVKKDVVKSFWLEVIDGNSVAERLYRTLGFEVTRGLECYRLDHPRPDASSCKLADFNAVSAIIQDYATCEPSWQNTTATITGLPLRCFLHVNGGAILGTGGMVHQIAAGSPSALEDLLSAAAMVGPLTLLNVDVGNSDLRFVLNKLGAHQFITQSEMRLGL